MYVKEGNGGYVVLNRDLNGGTDHTGGTVPDDAVEMSSNQQGTFTIYGLDGGTYYLKETDAPDGIPPITGSDHDPGNPDVHGCTGSVCKGTGGNRTYPAEIRGNSAYRKFLGRVAP